MPGLPILPPDGGGALAAGSAAVDAALAPDEVLRVERLAVQFGVPPRALDAVLEVGFSLRPGRTLALVGESGSGKSVTALSILRLTEPSGGRIVGGSVLLRGRDGQAIDLVRAPARVLRAVRGAAIAMVFQEPMTSLNPVLPVGEQIAEPIRLHRGASRAAARAEARRLLDLVRLPDAARILARYPHQLSGGQRQRVMIAMALACRPQVLIADEPTTALDVTVQAQILALIRAAQAELGMAVLFVTHDMGVVAETADEVVVMRRGRRVEAGDVRTLFAAPAHPYTRALLGAVPRLGAMRGTDAPARFGLPAPGGAPLPAAPPAQPPAAPSAPPLLQVRGLSARFDVHGGLLGRRVGRVHAVEQVDFDLAAGETLALVGESGCGKSTLARALLRLVDLQAGQVRFEGHDLAALPAARFRQVRRSIQMVFQDPYASLDPRMTVGASIAEPLRVHRLAGRGEAAAVVARLLESVGLAAQDAARYPHAFSGGQRQRIAIARALAPQPRIVVADEAVSALDVSIRAQIVDLLMDLQARLGFACLFISHDMAVVERVAHRVAVMRAGRIVEIGPRRAVFEQPAHPYTRALLAAVPVADPAARGRPRAPLPAGEPPSAVHALGDAPGPVRLRQVGAHHFVAADA